MSVTTMESRLTGKHILLILLGFFAIVGVVNAAFIYFAVSTGPGQQGAPAGYEVGVPLQQDPGRGANTERASMASSVANRRRLAPSRFRHRQCGGSCPGLP